MPQFQNSCAEEIEQRLQRCSEQQSVVANLGQAALRGEPVQWLFEEIVVAVSTLLGVEACAVLHDVDGGLRRAASIGWHDDSDGDTPAGAISSLILPISIGRGAPWGLLVAHSFQPRQFSTNEFDFLRAITSILAQAIERDRI